MENTKDLPEKEIDIEGNFKELDTIVEALESGKLSLQDSLREFERGIAIVKESNEALTGIEKKLRILTEEGSEDEL